MSNPSLVFDIADPHAPHTLDDEIVHFVCVGTAAYEGNSFAAVHRVPPRVFGYKRLITLFLEPSADLIDRVVPGNVLPIRSTGSANLRLGEASRAYDFLLERSALRAQCAAIDGMIRIPLYMDNLWSHVLGFVAPSVDDDATSHSAVRARGSSFRCAGDFERPQLRISWRQVKTEDRRRHTAQGRNFEEVSSRCIHESNPTFRQVSTASLQNPSITKRPPTGSIHGLYTRLRPHESKQLRPSERLYSSTIVAGNTTFVLWTESIVYPEP